MSDQSQGPGWWRASDGRWYPPETHPDYRPPAPPPPQPTASPTQPGMPYQTAGQQAWPAGQPGPAPTPKASGCLPWVIGGIALLVLLVIAAAVVIAVADSDDNASTVVASGASGDTEPTPGATSDAAGDTEPAPGATSDAAGADDEIDDVGPCTLVDDETITFEVLNNSSKQSSYIIDVNFLDDGGQRVGDESFFLNFVRAGELSREDHFVSDNGDGTTCEVAEVERFEAESADDVGEVTCEVTGVDAFDDIEAALTASNGSSGLSDYFITVTFVRDGVRVGTGFSTIENVKPGETVPGDAFTTTDGPAEGITCDVVHLERTASE